MAEIDIDKILEQNEKQETKKNLKSKAVLTGAIAGGLVLVSLIILFVAVLLKGTPADKYFPVRKDMKLIFNVQGGYPELWTFLENTETVGGYECAVLNRADQVKYSQVQEYYNYSEDGVVLVGYSRDYGKKRKVMMKILPGRIKKGAVFSAGSSGGTEIKGHIAETEELNTPAGEMEAIRVDYKGGSAVDKSIWFAEGFGIVKVSDRKKGERIDLVSSENK